MSKTNQHAHISRDYLLTEIGPFMSCKNPTCKGTMIEVLVSYHQKGKIFREYECSICGKVFKPDYKRNKGGKKNNYGNRGRDRRNSNPSKR